MWQEARTGNVLASSSLNHNPSCWKGSRRTPQGQQDSLRVYLSAALPYNYDPEGAVGMWKILLLLAGILSGYAWLPYKVCMCEAIRPYTATREAVRIHLQRECQIAWEAMQH